MKAVILAAGSGTRMYPLTERRPKSLLKVAGRSLLEWNLEALRGAGIGEVAIVENDRQVEESLKEYSGIDLMFVHQDKPEGTGAALLKAETSGDVLVLNGDNIVDAEGVMKLADEFRRKKGFCVMGVRKEEDLAGLGCVVLNSGGKVSRIAEKPKSPPSEYANLGAYAFDESIFGFLKKIGKSGRGEIELTDAIVKAIEGGNSVYGCEIGFWHHLTYPWDLLRVNEELLKGLKTRIEGTVEKGATVKGEIYVGEGALVKNGAYVEGPAYIGRNVTVGPNCFIRAHTYLDNWVRVGNSVEIKNSIIYEKTYVSHLAYVGDSVIGRECNFGAGTVCANLRFDNSNCRVKVGGKTIDTGRRKLGLMMGDRSQTGINSTINPGKRIGAGSCVGPGVIVAEDVPSGKKVYLKQALEKK